MRSAHTLALLCVLLCLHATASAPRIPLVQGMVFSSANAWSWGDEENIATLSMLDEANASFSVEFRDPQAGTHSDSSRTWTRRVRRQDLVDSHRLNNLFQEGDPELFPGATFMHLSAAALSDLKTKGETAMVLGTINDAEYESMRMRNELAAKENFMFPIIASGRKYFRGTLKRVGSGTVPITVLVNGVPQQLPAIETAGQFTVGGDVVDARYWWLDDPQNALQLRSTHGQLVRIDYPKPAPEKTLEQSLGSGDCRANLPGIYFDTGSATLLAASDAALKTVTSILKANPSWTLTVEGHTDNVGKPADNLDLSKRRATAVQSALQSRFGVAATRLAASGYGAERPVQTNDTLEGRAANRRVELVRPCS